MQMKQVSYSAQVVDQLPKEALDILIKWNQEYEPEKTEFETIDDIIEIIKEAGNHEDEKDYCYINNTYSLVIQNWRFECYSQNYLKDHCICDEEMLDEITLFDLEAEKEIKAIDKENKKIQNISSWTELFKDKTKEELFNILKNSKFPKL